MKLAICLLCLLLTFLVVTGECFLYPAIEVFKTCAVNNCEPYGIDDIVCVHRAHISLAHAWSRCLVKKCMSLNKYSYEYLHDGLCIKEDEDNLAWD